MQNINNVLVSADALKQSTMQKRRISEYVTEILLQINKELKDAKSDGKHYIITEIPFIFDIPHISQEDASRAIWAQTISILKNKGFDVKINATKDMCRLKISWISQEEHSLIQSQIRLIKSCSEDF